MMTKAGGQLLRFLRREQLRIVLVLLICAVAAGLATWLTPYHEKPTTQFYVDDTPQVTSIRGQVTELHGNTGKVRIIDGPQRGQILPVKFYSVIPRIGSEVLLQEDTTVDTPNSVTQIWRLPSMIIMVAFMLILVIVIGGKQGALSILGLAVSIWVIMYYVIPAALGGANALVASSIGAFAIATIAIIIAHRLRWRTLVSLLSIYLALALVLGLAIFSGWFMTLSGVYDETSSILNLGGRSNLDMYGILLGGIIIASLGVLDDVVTTQVAAVDELRQAKPHASRRELFGRGMSVGREHLSALINTLALAYVGVALPTLLIVSQQVTSSTQLMNTLNYEYIAVEITRTIVSSIGIIVAIPLSTALAVVLVGRRQEFLAMIKKQGVRKP